MMKKLLLIGLISCSSYAYDGELKDATEGAPQHITDEASYRIWQNGHFKLAKTGTNSFTCLVLADAKGRFEPTCLNAVAMESVFPVYELQTRLLEQGVDIKEIHKRIADKAKSGVLPAAKPGAIVYMMSPRNRYYDYFGKQLMDIKPHIMLYSPKLKSSDLGLNAQQGLPGYYDEYPHLGVIHVETEAFDKTQK